MGNVQSVNCFERFGKRRPDGALLKGPRSVSTAAPSGSQSIVGGGRGAQGAAVGPGASPVPADGRGSKRRPSVSRAKRALQISEPSDEDDDFEDDEDSEAEGLGTTSAADLRRRELLQFRKKLSVLVKIGTGVLRSTVKLGLDESCKSVIWCSKDKKVITSIPLDKLVKVQASAADPKALELSSRNPTLEKHIITFKTSEGREAWQQTLESLQKFVSIA